MAIDHFEARKSRIGRTDWNFNFLFENQTQVTELAGQYAPVIQHPGLHKPVPPQWLHATLLRVGFLEDFTEAEMLAVADKLASRLADIQMPELMLGKHWRLWNGGPFLSITPEKQLYAIFRHLMSSLEEVVGRDRLPVLTIPSGGYLEKILGTFVRTIGSSRLPARLQFKPHVTLAYPKSYKDQASLRKQLRAHPVSGVPIRINKVSLIKQHIVGDYYAWEVVKDVPIGRS
jgi:2'-5' RNA ligase